MPIDWKTDRPTFIYKNEKIKQHWFLYDDHVLISMIYNDRYHPNMIRLDIKKDYLIPDPNNVNESDLIKKIEKINSLIPFS